MAVITITRQYGAGGSLVARLLAERLGWTVIDNEFVGEVAQRAGLPPEEIAAREERAPSLLERLAAALALSAPEMFAPAAAAESGEADEERLIRITERVIEEAAAHGRVVLVGRGAASYLGTADEGAHALHVYVVAPRAVRVKTVMGRLSVDEAEAARTVHEVDAARERYLERYYRRRRDDAASYHLVVNTAWLGYEGAADTVVELARRRGLV
ncbi:MAG TPA: cytidylate kinase-like family protein [Gemmatimonadales bacterium]|nr:cytidylate kinase-like family protein [Gemmatimonadales bacterium]